jgi:hypothetical protein
LLAVPASIVMLSALCDVDGFSAQGLAEVLSRAGEALTLGEWGLLRYRPE